MAKEPLVTFEAGLDAIWWPEKSIAPATSKTRCALQLLRDLMLMAAEDFMRKYPSFVDLECRCGTYADWCTCEEEAIMKWGLKV